jgi:hypothetical protein
MTRRENILRAVRFERPEHIPVNFVISGACWNHYEHGALHELMLAHETLFPGFDPETWSPPPIPPWQQTGGRHTDSWGCVWQTSEPGYTGAVVEHPLADWNALESYTPPDPAAADGWQESDWQALAERFARQREAGELCRGSLRHGHTFLTLTYLRGYENLMFDMIDEDPRLGRLLEMVEAFNAERVRRFLDLGAEWMGYPEDLGMQVGPMLSPAQFRRWIKPSYERLMDPAREAGAVVHMHSDGDIRTLVEDLIDGGVDVVNLQDLVNGVDWIAATLKGRVAVDLDIDRQAVTVHGTPAEVDAHVRHCVETLGSPEGGLLFTYGLYPGTPLANVAALMDAFEHYGAHHA